MEFTTRSCVSAKHNYQSMSPCVSAKHIYQPMSPCVSAKHSYQFMCKLQAQLLTLSPCVKPITTFSQWVRVLCQAQLSANEFGFCVHLSRASVPVSHHWLWPQCTCLAFAHSNMVRLTILTTPSLSLEFDENMFNFGDSCSKLLESVFKIQKITEV